MIDTTVDKTGLSINLFIMPVGFVVNLLPDSYRDVNRQSSIVNRESSLLAYYVCF